LGGHTVHAIRGWADEDLFAARNAEGADERIDRFIGADTDEEVAWAESLGSVSVGVAEGAELLFEVFLVAVSYSVN
jgi:hypothetical protein